MDMNKGDTAVVFIDPQNDVLSDKGLGGLRSRRRPARL
jgi:hypothetical protein